MELFIQSLFAFLMLVGAAGALLPLLPGAPLAFGSLLLARLLNFSDLNWWMIGLFGFLTILGIILDYAVPIATTKKMGGSKYGIWGLMIGLVVGILFAPFGLLSIIIAPFLGALAGELVYDFRNQKRAFKAASGTIIGYFLTSGYGVLLSLTIFVVYLFYDILR